MLALSFFPAKCSQLTFENRFGESQACSIEYREIGQLMWLPL